MEIGSEWTEIRVRVMKDDAERAESICQMASNSGLYIEDYSTLLQDAMEIAHIDLIDEELLKKDRENVLIHLYLSAEYPPAETVAFLRERLDAEKITYTLDLEDCFAEDWINNWKQYFKPIPVGEKLLIHPVWEEKFDPDGRVVIDLEPGLAFGTGTHETTRLCLELLEKHVSPNDAVLDVGCGSGILSVAALLLGAKEAVGIDIDELAVKTAAENAKMNHVSDRFTALCGDLTEKVSGKYRIVLANIVADVLLRLTKNITAFMVNGAVYILSGIISDRKEEVLKALEDEFFILEIREERGWVAIAAQRKGF